MEIEYDCAKNDRNITERGLSFDLARHMIWAEALVIKDLRKDYEETRYQALGPIQGRLYVLVFTIRDTVLRIISLRKANAREVAKYEKAKSRTDGCR